MHNALGMFPLVIKGWKNEKFSLARKIFRQINSLVLNLFSKPLLSRNFCQKCVRENSFNFYNVAMWQRFSFSIKSKQTLGKLQMFQFDKLLREINYIVFNTSI